jgi:hypothetical protein
MTGFDGKPVELPKKTGHALTRSPGRETGPGPFIALSCKNGAGT